jgi:hypothetical protein
MFYAVHCSIANENQQNAQMIYIFSQSVEPTPPPHSALASTQDISNIYTQLFNFLI